MELTTEPFLRSAPNRDRWKDRAEHDEAEVEQDSAIKASEENALQAMFGARPSGWKSGIYYGITVDVSVFVVVFVLIFVAAFVYPRNGLLAVLIDGNCSKTRSWGIWLHLLINILSTALLATSSYAMQCLIAPTRVDLDQAHQKGRFMDIGVPSFKNVFHVNRRRASLYVLAVLSSIPIHLLANSVVFQSFSTNSYLLTVAYQQFIDEPLSGVINATELGSQDYYTFSSFNSDRSYINPQTGLPMGNPSEDVHFDDNPTVTVKMLTSNMTRLENEDCIRAYSNSLLTDRRHVVAVSDAQLPPFVNESIYSYTAGYWYQSIDICPTCQTFFNWTDPTVWTCAFLSGQNSPHVRSCDSSAAASHASQFTIQNSPISYCLSEEIEESCQLQADVGIMSAVIVCTAIKICVLVMATCTIPGEIISTIGDAISSFLNRPEKLTADCCLLSFDDVRRREQRSEKLTTGEYPDQAQPLTSGSASDSVAGEQGRSRWILGKPYLKHWRASSMEHKYNEALSLRHWAGAVFVLLSILVLATALLITAIMRIKSSSGLQGSMFSTSIGAPPTSIASLWRMGFGAFNANFLLPLHDMASSSHSSTMQHVLIVNAPQIALSISYFAYNDLWTNVLVAREWATYGNKRQGLRVSQRRSDYQRSSYFLTVPYAFGIPLQISSALLHWLMSQSIFLARVNVYSGEPFVHFPVSIINTVGYSPIALFFLILLWIILLVGIYLTGILFKFKSPIPIVGSCSLAISAACHPLIWEQHNGGIALKEVMWGMTLAEPVDENVRVETIEEIETEIRHCSFSAEEVISPQTLPTKKIKLSGVLESKALFR